MKKEFDSKLKAQSLKYQQKIAEKVAQGSISNTYRALRKLEFGGSVTQSSFDLPSYVDENLSANQCAERLANYFCKISQEFEPLMISNLPPWIQQKINKSKEDSSKPILEEYQVYQKIKSAKKPMSSFPGDIPVQIVKEFTPELAKPVSVIFNRITITGEYPRQWIVEQQICIPKKSPPQSEEELRNISGTAFFSKVYESFLGQWLFPYVEPYLDPGQCGGLKGSSITHYLVKLLHFIHTNLDKREPHAVLLALIDLEKAFNRVSHQFVIEDLADMHVPGWILLILISYLTGRSMFMRYKGKCSSMKLLPGSTLQGTYLGILLFIIIFNGALLRPEVPRPLSLSLKYVDDLSILQAVNLRASLSNDPTSRHHPLTYAERTQQVLLPENNPLQQSLIELHQFTSSKLMKIKETKTNIMKFNFSRSYDFPPEVQINGFCNDLSVVPQTKLLGVIITEDLKWDANTTYICQKALKRLWILRRMKLLNVEPAVILDVYTKEIRSVLELASPAWHSGLTRKQTADIERIQKIAVKIILSKDDKATNSLSYRTSLSLLGIESLEERRRKLCVNFAKKAIKSRHSDLFKENLSTYATRSRHPFTEHHANSKRAFTSPLVYLTRLLNSTYSS